MGRYFTVLFGVSRSIGIGSQVRFAPNLYFQLFTNVPFEFISIVFFPFDVQLIWDRALGLPLERPKSVTMDWLDSYCKKAASP